MDPAPDPVASTGSTTTPVAVVIRNCLGLTISPRGDRPVHLVLQQPSGRLHVLQLDYSTALAIALAIRADVRC